MGFRTLESMLQRLALQNGIPSQEAGARIHNSLEEVGLGISERKRLRNLTEEERWLLELAKATLPSPKHLVLYHAMTDPSRFQAAQQRIAEGWNPAKGLLLFMTEDVSFIEQVCDHLVLMQGTEILVQGKISELVPSSYRVQVHLKNLNDDALRSVRNIATKLRFEKVPITQFTAYVPHSDDFGRIRASLEENGVTILSFLPETPSLADFIHRKRTSALSR